MNEMKTHCVNGVDVMNSDGDFVRQCADCGVTYATHNKDYIFCDECNAKPPSQEEVDEMMDLVDELKESLSTLSSNLKSGKSKLTPECKKALLSLTE